MLLGWREGYRLRSAEKATTQSSQYLIPITQPQEFMTMTISPLAGKRAPKEILIDVDKLRADY